MSTVDQLVTEGIVRRDVPLGPMTTYKAGGPAELFAEVSTDSELELLIDSGLARDRPVVVVGRGSNLVVADQGFPGLVVKLSGDFMSSQISGEEVTAGGAVPLPRLARQAVDSELLGLEFFVGVPGSVGGAVRQNAGCFGVETKDCLIAARIVDLETGATTERGAASLDLDYRRSNVASTEVVVSASFRGNPGDPAVGKKRMREVTRWRKEHQPGGTLNAGSVFKNPPEVAAGKLIDDLGLKRTAVGGVSVSDKHANFFVATSEATSDDIYRLVHVVKDTVFERTGTILEPEIQFVGFDRWPSIRD